MKNAQRVSAMMSSQVPAGSGYYYVQMSEGGPKVLARIEGNRVENIFGRSYDVTMFSGVKFGEPIPSEEECTAIWALRDWRDKLLAEAKADPKGVIARCVAAFPPPRG